MSKKISKRFYRYLVYCRFMKFPSMGKMRRISSKVVTNTILENATTFIAQNIPRILRCLVPQTPSATHIKFQNMNQLAKTINLIAPAI